MHHIPKNTNQIVFVFVLISVGILVVFSSIILVNNKTFADKTYFRTILDDASGLRAKPPIYFKGLEIGRIDSFRLNPDTNDIEVGFWIFDQYKGKIVKYSVLAGKQSSLLDEVSSFELLLPSIIKVKKYQPLAEGDFVPYIDSELARAYIKNGIIAQQTDSLDSIIESVNNLLLNLQKENNPEAGSLFRILDRVAKITDHLLSVSESLRKSTILPEAEQAIKDTQIWLRKLPETMAQFDRILNSSQALIEHADQVVSSYGEPARFVKEVTGGKVPVVLDNLNASLTVLQSMLKDVHAQREQLVIMVNQVQQVLDKLDKTLQGLNNNPLLREGIEKQPENTGIEVND